MTVYAHPRPKPSPRPCYAAFRWCAVCGEHLWHDEHPQGYRCPKCGHIWKALHAEGVKRDQ